MNPVNRRGAEAQSFLEEVCFSPRLRVSAVKDFQ